MARRLPDWLRVWSAAGVLLSVPLVALNLPLPLLSPLLDRLIASDPQYRGCWLGAIAVLNEGLLVIGLVYFVQFHALRRTAAMHLAVHATLGLLAIRGLLELGERYVQIN